MVWWLGLALAGDVWMTVEAEEDGQQIRLELPVNALADEEEPAMARTSGGKTVDLREEVKALRKRRDGTTRRYVVDEVDGDTWPIVLSSQGPAKREVDTLAVSISAQGGFALTLDLPLDDAAGEALEQTVDVDLGPPGVALDLEGANEAQLRRGGERTLLRLVGPAGKGLEVRTVQRTP